MEFSAASARELDRLYNGKRQHIELTIGILKDGKKEIVHYGPDRQETDETDLVYAAGSICKPFTMSLAAKLISEGKLDLDAPINRYIEGLPDRYYPSLRRLATHSSGFKTEPYTLLTTIPFFVKMNKEGGLFHTNPFRGYPNEEQMMEILRNTKLENRIYPFVYSNIGMSVLGYIAGKVSGEGFWDEMNRYILEDLGLRHTFLGNIEMTGYDRKDNPCRCWQWEKEDIIAPAGAINSTMEDLLDFAVMNFDGSHPYLYMNHQVNGLLDKENDMGLAWRLSKKAPVSWHTGSAGAFSCWLGFDRVKKTAVSVGINYGLVNAEQLGFAILESL